VVVVLIQLETHRRLLLLLRVKQTLVAVVAATKFKHLLPVATAVQAL
jgi:hypothetical protein